MSLRSNSEDSESDLTLEDLLKSPDRVEDIQIFKKAFFDMLLKPYLLGPPKNFETNILDEKFDHSLVYRNFAWLPKIRNLMKDKKAFIAVGLGHLYGEMGLLHQLELYGYEVTRVPE